MTNDVLHGDREVEEPGQVRFVFGETIPKVMPGVRGEKGGMGHFVPHTGHANAPRSNWPWFLSSLAHPGVEDGPLFFLQSIQFEIILYSIWRPLFEFLETSIVKTFKALVDNFWHPKPEFTDQGASKTPEPPK